MRGSPLLQALILLLCLLALGYAGHRFIHMDETPSPFISTSMDATDPAISSSMVNAEIEVTFSSPPTSYQLTTPSNDPNEATNHPSSATSNPQPPSSTSSTLTLVSSSTSEAMENPSYSDATIPSHQLTTYWLDATWSDPPADNSRHFIRITLSPDSGQSQSFTFFTDTEEIYESFDFNTSEEPTNHHHE